MLLINYNENDTEYLKKYNLNIDNEIFTQVYQVKFPNLFKKGDIIRIDNKFPFDNFANAYTLMCYYYERDNIENAKRYAKMIVRISF